MTTWYKPADRLPENYEVVCVWVQYGTSAKRGVAQYNAAHRGISAWWREIPSCCDDDFFPSDNVLEWCSLPKHPKEK